MALISLNAVAAATGGVQVLQSAVQFGSFGFQIASSSASYPREILDFLPDGKYKSREVIRFMAHGYWTNTCSVAMAGFFSDDWNALVAQEAHPDIPANRYIKSLNFFEGADSETLTLGLLTVDIKALETVLGSAEDPKLGFEVSGRFDPVGWGDERYSFRMMIDTHGYVTYDTVRTTSRITMSKDPDEWHMSVDLWQYL